MTEQMWKRKHKRHNKVVPVVEISQLRYGREYPVWVLDKNGEQCVSIGLFATLYEAEYDATVAAQCIGGIVKYRIGDKLK